MIRGNEPAIDLALGVLEATHPNCSMTLDEIAAYIDAAREILGLQTEPFRKQARAPMSVVTAGAFAADEL